MTDGDVAVTVETTMAPEGAIVVFAVLLAALSAVVLRAYRGFRGQRRCGRGAYRISRPRELKPPNRRLRSALRSGASPC
ncbi:hypothetical protein SAMN05445850_4841 [Paraburkholderia tuberum]|uniref:Uncharacterized protein n=1 Tax=Paraburkholderia tuberum TaxID=157910 RepID=A0A1H1JHE6_9BURK|nr:hypothetical protein SAMN05445850_4841 [Paraburkholderia tuberum]